MGGDDGLKATVPAAILAAKKHANVCFTLVGDQKKIAYHIKRHGGEKFANIDVFHASESVGMDEAPAIALRNKKDSSMRQAINLVKDGSANACVSAGNTGALMATARFVLKMLPGVDRPAIVYALPALCSKSPGGRRPVYMLDLGANIDCSADQLFQFGLMGSVLAQSIHHTKNLPKVRLLNIGEEEVKGLQVIKDAAELMKSCDAINYDGYVEPNDIFFSEADVIVCDGFVGNVTLKSTEGIIKFLSKVVKRSFTKSIFSKLCALFALPVLKKIKEEFDVRQYNGASLLGLKGVVVKSHGYADSIAFLSAIEKAIEEARESLPEQIAMVYAKVNHQK